MPRRGKPARTPQDNPAGGTMTEAVLPPAGMVERALPRAWPVLLVSTFAFVVCFAVWMMLGVIGIPIRKALGLNNTEFGLLTATPVLLGAVLRLPLGVWTDRFGGRIVMTLLLLVAAVPVYALSYATAYWQFLAIGRSEEHTSELQSPKELVCR